MKLKGKAKAAFLRRMARGRNKASGKHPKHPKRKTKHRKEHHVAKRKHSKHKSKHRTARRRNGIDRFTGRFIPAHNDLVSMGSAFAYGKVEGAASTDANHTLNKVPNLIARIGRAGNLGAIIWVGGVMLRSPLVKAVAKGVLDVAAYQNGRQKTPFTKDAPTFTMSGPGRPGRGRDELLVEQYLRDQAGRDQ